MFNINRRILLLLLDDMELYPKFKNTITTYVILANSGKAPETSLKAQNLPFTVKKVIITGLVIYFE